MPNAVAYTKFDDFEYLATKGQVDDSDLYVVDMNGVKTFMNIYDGERVPYVVYIKADGLDRLENMIRRGDSLTNAVRRIQHDKEAFKDVYDYATGRKLAGLLSEECNELIDTEQELYKTHGSVYGAFTANTTLGVVITNGKFSKTAMNKIAAMAQNGLARSIRPVHTSIDGDSVYAMSVGNVEANEDLVGTLASTVMAEAIKQAIVKAEPIYGCKAYKDFFRENKSTPY